MRNLKLVTAVLLFIKTFDYSLQRSLLNHTMRMSVTGKRINRGAGYGLEILVEYVFNGNEKALQ